LSTDNTDDCKKATFDNVQELRELWCFRCLESCPHAKGKGSFDHRTQTWYDRLFLNRPQMDPSDPRLKEISGKSFLPIVGVNGGPPTWSTPDETVRPTLIQVPSVLNTSFPKEGIILTGFTPPKTAADPGPVSWGVPEKKPQNLVKPGAKIKMGGGDSK